MRELIKKVWWRLDVLRRADTSARQMISVIEEQTLPSYLNFQQYPKHGSLAHEFARIEIATTLLKHEWVKKLTLDLDFDQYWELNVWVLPS